MTETNPYEDLARERKARKIAQTIYVANTFSDSGILEKCRDNEVTQATWDILAMLADVNVPSGKTVLLVQSILTEMTDLERKLDASQ